MRDALAYEFVRIRTIRSTFWLSVMALVVGVGIATLISWGTHHDLTTNGPSPGDLKGLGPIVVTQAAATGALPSLVSFLLAMIGIFAWGHEYRHGMIRASLTALNSRTNLWIAKYAVVAVWVAVVGFVTMVISGLVGTLFLHSYATILDGQTWSIIGRQLLYAVILTWMAMAFTAVTRSQAFALVTIFIWPLLVETLISVLVTVIPGLNNHTSLLRFLPFRAGNHMVDVLDKSQGVFNDPMSPLGGTIIFGGLALVLVVVSFVLFSRRDA